MQQNFRNRCIYTLHTNLYAFIYVLYLRMRDGNVYTLNVHAHANVCVCACVCFESRSSTLGNVSRSILKCVMAAERVNRRSEHDVPIYLICPLHTQL